MTDDAVRLLVPALTFAGGWAIGYGIGYVNGLAWAERQVERFSRLTGRG
jgi:hypothetical protein